MRLTSLSNMNILKIFVLRSNERSFRWVHIRSWLFFGLLLSYNIFLPGYQCNKHPKPCSFLHCTNSRIWIEISTSLQDYWWIWRVQNINVCPLQIRLQQRDQEGMICQLGKIWEFYLPSFSGWGSFPSSFSNCNSNWSGFSILPGNSGHKMIIA